MTIELAMLAPHVPSMCHFDQVPDFQKDMAIEMQKMSKTIYDLKPDAIVLVSCHWPSTFFHYVDCTPVHKGILTAFECPDLIRDVPYEYPGDKQLGDELVKIGQDAGLQVVGIDDPYYVWDYGTVVPLRYLVPNEDIPVVNLSVTMAATLDETYKWGQLIAKVLKESEKKIVFVSSGALSHNLVRGRHNKPTASEHALDKQFISYILNKEYDAAYQMLPQYARLAKVESGGRHLAMLLSMLEDDDQPKYWADGQSSGSWNALITFEKVSQPAAPKVKN
ncbi:MEMO1 family protein [Aeribacillus composti]|jgi:3,4-dihydroxyphenylacetate 2,3-dioxygenase|uniref:Extradiol ring-cleavage dioxygenase n=1 Tax=Aeribacillus pallidus TaxID=33936 RepID=A0A161Y2V6_9BACI|nr:MULTISPECIES: MEMO1 family protein [Aeribacillus]KZN95962.1 extradiol ring-cleavage dioxygenase [Aeribacillus pallidus]MED0714649.1 MEMO1 family protein [Aeribacillus composti]MED0744652.1 MEMO1 family protein [Aeribacillus composti]BBU38006.1 3,4-dihydroxyphenylacetate 2,3-dioxygenase [Aeribacillus pallidus]